MTENCKKHCHKCNCSCTKIEKDTKCSNCRYCTEQDDHIKKPKNSVC